jgi:hypothetical protein
LFFLLDTIRASLPDIMTTLLREAPFITLALAYVATIWFVLDQRELAR